MKHSVFIKNWRPTPLNRLMFAKVRDRIKRLKADKEMVFWHMRHAEIPKATGKRRVSLEIVLEGRQRASDADSPWKVLLDALVASGQLVGDSLESVELGTISYQRKARGREDVVAGTLIVLEDV